MEVQTMTCLISAVAALMASILTAVSTSFLNDACNRRTRQRMYRRVAIAYINAYLAEVKVGRAVLESFIKGSPISPMPTRCWEVYRLSEDVMDVILLASAGKPVMKGFPPENLLSDLKNYYSYVCGNVNSHVESRNALSSTDAITYRDATKDIVDMLFATLDNLNVWKPSWF